MEQGMLELLEKISQSTSFMAVAGTVAVLFLFVFAQSIFGSKTTHSQLRELLRRTEDIAEQLKRIAGLLSKEAGDCESLGQEDRPAKEADAT